MPFAAFAAKDAPPPLETRDDRTTPTDPASLDEFVTSFSTVDYITQVPLVISLLRYLKTSSESESVRISKESMKMMGNWVDAQLVKKTLDYIVFSDNGVTEASIGDDDEVHLDGYILSDLIEMAERVKNSRKRCFDEDLTEEDLRELQQSISKPPLYIRPGKDTPLLPSDKPLYYYHIIPQSDNVRHEHGFAIGEAPKLSGTADSTETSCSYTFLYYPMGFCKAKKAWIIYDDDGVSEDITGRPPIIDSPYRVYNPFHVASIRKVRAQ